MARLNLVLPFFHIDLIGQLAGMPPEGFMHVDYTQQRTLERAHAIADLYDRERSRLCLIFHPKTLVGTHLAHIVNRDSAVPLEPVSWLAPEVAHQIDSFANIARAVIMTTVRRDLRRSASNPSDASIAAVIVDPRLIKKLACLFSAHGLAPREKNARGSTSLLAASVPVDKRLRLTFQGVESSSFAIC